jgi:hypothetical protein
MCKKRLNGLEKECTKCQTDVSLLVDYVENLQEGLVRADALTRQGELGEAVWAYLEVLEVDPDNATARRQVGQVVTAVRQFDKAAPGRRWLKQLQRQTRFRRWAANLKNNGDAAGWVSGTIWFAIVLGALILGFFLGWSRQFQPAASSTPPATTTPVGEGK